MCELVWGGKFRVIRVGFTSFVGLDRRVRVFFVPLRAGSFVLFSLQNCIVVFVWLWVVWFRYALYPRFSFPFCVLWDIHVYMAFVCQGRLVDYARLVLKLIFFFFYLLDVKFRDIWGNTVWGFYMYRIGIVVVNCEHEALYQRMKCIF
jgi:hypothetical protein